MTVPFTVFSFGGSGSKHLVKKLCGELHLSDYGRYHSHERRPTPRLLADCGRAIFLHADPIDAVMSFFARRISRTDLHGFRPSNGTGDSSWAVKHCRNIGGRFQLIRPEWDFDAYLRQGEDLFELESFVRNWIDVLASQDVLFLRYEAMWRESARIASFMGFDHGFVERFGFPVERRSRADTLDASTLERALAIYGPVRDLLGGLDDVFVLSARLGTAPGPIPGPRAGSPGARPL